MPENREKLLEQLNICSKDRRSLWQIVISLSLVVIVIVFWSLKLTGIGIAGEAFCGKSEHSHSDECLTKELICTLEEAEAHQHSESCILKTLICGQEEIQAHQHSESCLAKTLVCQLEENAEHTHTDTCRSLGKGFGCGLSEADGHIHTAACLTEETELSCNQEATEGHAHTDACRSLGKGFGCGLLEADGHTHTSECLTEETELGCNKEATEGHTHTDECYKQLDACPLEAHIHDETCYSNINADLETSDDWEKTLADIARGPVTKENVVLVAGSQLGYTESTLNFQVDAQGIRRGITRYGQWYGNPYGDWSAMFVSFCLEYAGATGLPMNAGPEAMRLEWEQAGLYKPAAEFSPQVGNLVFLYNDSGQTAASVAIITGVEADRITVIEGDLDDSVQETSYSLFDNAVMGYGLVPDRSEITILAAAPDGAAAIAKTVAYSQSLFTDTNCFVVYTVSGDGYYAFDGAGNAVQIYIDSEGNILSNVADPDTLLWSFSGSDGTYTIQNLSSGRYMHAYPNNGSGVTTTGAYSSTLIGSGDGAKIRSNSEYARLDVSAGQFVMTQDVNAAAVYQFGVTQRCTVWVDGTAGGMDHLTGSPNTAYSAQVGSTIKLPESWTSPDKYSYKLRGWYDVTNSQYYPPGAEMAVTGNTVLYADWVASTYDVGVFNAQVADTVSTNGFITTYMFDYNYLFNIHSANAQVTVNASSHSETWSMVTSGAVDHGGAETYDFIFVDNDSNGRLCMPNNRSSHNVYPGSGIVTPNIYSSQIGRLVFATDNAYDPATGTGVLGKTYLGTGDHLFQIMDDPNDEHYGYYYYDSRHNAASYNQSRRRFYVYEYLAATSDAIGSTYSDFLPLNSPYANTNGKAVGSYNYAGVDGEYEGVPHFRYDSKYDSGNYNSADNVITNYAYGMRTDIKFYLPNEPGTGGNKDLYGNDLQFQFSGDDDLWVLIDGVLVLDIGGIHGAEEGAIDFSTGLVTVQGNRQTSLMDLGIGAGDHTLSVRYLERGSSMSNCSIYFNLAPRFGVQLRKEDVLTQELLDGTEFTVYEDLECTKTAELWKSEADYNQDLADKVLDQYQSTFTVTGGIAEFWGLGSGNTYYIKETGPPGAEGYGVAQGVIRLKIEKDGVATYHVDVIADAQGNEPSNGFTVHGVRIDEETKTVYIVVTNAPESVVETTTVQVIKKWEDTVDHSGDYIQAYLTVTDPDGTVRRIREITLSDENQWMYTWTNLPKYDYDALTEVQYGIEESYESGYYSTVRKITQIEISRTEWAEAASFVNGESYILGHSNGYLSTVSASDATLCWVEEATAKESALATWTATVSGGKVKLTNGAGQTLTFVYNSNSSRRYFHATTATSGVQTFTPVDAGTGFRFYATRNNSSSGTKYYMASSGINSNGRISTTTGSSGGLILTPMKKITQTDIQQVEDWAYQITNTPLAADNETSLSVSKNWVIPEGYDAALYQQYDVTVRLFAGGVNTGRTMTLSLKNNWQGVFQGLPYRDDNGNVIVYTVDEVWEKEKWSTTYGEVQADGGAPPDYSVTITNTYHPGGPELPSTGSAARLMYVLCGSAIMLGTLVYGIVSRRKRERRRK